MKQHCWQSNDFDPIQYEIDALVITMPVTAQIRRFICVNANRMRASTMHTKAGKQVEKVLIPLFAFLLLRFSMHRPFVRTTNQHRIQFIVQFHLASK